MAEGTFKAWVPGAQLVQAAQDALLDDVLNVPAVQETHCRSFPAPGVATTCVPSGQMAQTEQTVALIVVLWLPLGHGVQVRSAMAEPALLTKLPGPQSVFLIHSVAGFPSWSQVLSRQGTRGAAPPRHNSPATHVLHSKPDISGEASCLTVPAGQSVACRHTLWFSWDVVIPAAHAVQTRSLVDVGTPET